MRVIYVAYIGRLTSVGVLKKIETKIDKLSSYGLNIKGLVFITDKPHEKKNVYSSQNIELIQIGVEEELYDYLDNYLKHAATEADLVFFRYPIASKRLLKFAKAHGPKLVFEHNSKEAEEILSQVRVLTFRDYLYMIKKGDLRPVTIELKKFWEEKKYGPQVLSYARGGIAVTQEIADYESARAKSYNSKVVSNGVDVKSIEALPNISFDGQELKMMLLSASPNNWHGWDRILNGVKNYNGPVRITLYLIGLFNPKIKKLAQELTHHNIIFTGLLSKDEINAISKNIHLGVGTLALHRIPLKQGSVLKVREYLAMGLPVIYGYEDIDLLCTESKRYALRVPADESPIDIPSVIEFTKEVYANRNMREALRTFALERIDMKVKMMQLKSALESY